MNWRQCGYIVVFVIPLLTPTVICARAVPMSVPVPEAMVLDIARRTLVAREGAPPTEALVAARAVDVRHFLASMGGDKWFGDYLRRFGAPTLEDEAKVSTLIGLFAPRLAVYYIHTQRMPPPELDSEACKSANLTTAGFCALANWNAAELMGDKAARGRFMEFATRFRELQKGGRWEWATPISERSLEPGWISGLTQSLGISVMLRAYQHTGDASYFRSATAALRWLRRSIDQGGVSVRMPTGTWFEEYPDKAVPSHVLNGHMWALFGIWDFYRVTGNAESRRMFESGIRALEAYIFEYDVGGWSVYSRENKEDFVTGPYQQFIVEQLRVLEVITQSRALQTYRELWECSLLHNGLFVHLAAGEFSRSKGIGPIEPGYPAYCVRLKRD